MNLPLHWKRQIPNGLTMSRLVLTPGLLLWLWVDDARGFLLYGLALTLTDVLDGVLARRWKVMTDRGRDLDGKADMVFVTTFYGGAVWFLWDEIAAAWPIVLLPILLFALLQPLGYLLTGKPRQIHLISKKITSIAFVLWISISLWAQFNYPFLMLFNVLTLAVFIEEITLYLILRTRIDENLVSILQLRNLKNSSPLGRGTFYGPFFAGVYPRKMAQMVENGSDERQSQADRLMNQISVTEPDEPEKN
ncbi:MAG: CDP-alcohol phosphatidyltransferase family protein [Chloroflexi bacterium]|nr:CDP-alcohol phosphatidyltransferase family protein [Chloroflexota bacterium]MBP8059739.1 CDP-alcohol phosphatidyltransferase family protein [Chloroflexota bacterium]